MPTTAIPFIAGNWKMHGLKSEALDLVVALGKGLQSSERHCDVAIFPPATLLSTLSEFCQQYTIGLGGQDCFYEERGAFTGDISPIMLKDAGCQYVLLGHSERRSLHEETSIAVHKKAKTAHKAGLITVICIGETLEHKENGQTLTVLQEQIVESIPKTATPGNTIIAYEPVWAIGTGKTPSLAEITEIHHFIHDSLLKPFEKPFRILYGGSVKSGNAREIIEIEHVNGLLVGGASLEAEEFLRIIKAAKHIKEHSS